MPYICFPDIKKLKPIDNASEINSKDILMRIRSKSHSKMLLIASHTHNLLFKDPTLNKWINIRISIATKTLTHQICVLA